MTSKLEDLAEMVPNDYEVAYDEAVKAVAARNREWEAKWPNYCEKCAGWGGFAYTEMHGFTHGAGETIFDPCEARDIEICHRCNEVGLNDEGEGPCSKCGWNYDDGIEYYC